MYHYKINHNYLSKTWKKKRTGYINLDDEKLIKNSKIDKKLKNLNKGFKQKNDIGVTGRKKIVNSINWLYHIAEWKKYITKNGKHMQFKISFLTLTLPCKQMHTDGELVKLALQPILNNLRQNYDLQNYVWRAEIQKNGNLHFHIITDTPINYWLTLKNWNNILSKLGYIEQFRKLNPKSNFPNSVDVKRAGNIKKIGSYLAKYLAKKRTVEDNQRTLNCRHYDLSYSLSRLQEFSKQNQDICEIAYVFSRHCANVITKINDWAEVKIIRLRELTAVFPWIVDEIKKRLKEQFDLRPCRVTSYYQITELQMKMYFSN